MDIVNTGEYAFKVKAKDYEFVVDPRGKGVTPPDAFLASLGTCVGVYLRKYAEGAGLILPEFQISVDAEFSTEKPVCFRKIGLKIDLKGMQLDKRRMKAMHEFVMNCPIHNTLKQNPEVEVKFV
ncbi:MAG: OsmC family protein [Candidatus Omnitrophica bacterium]|nr:OsmC family protein [Candidatus Omnitrophota bacterium]MBU1906414.1 OsmC family protein [Candidatus Omnitrophota bacterium]